jgi:hypothetical protein
LRRECVVQSRALQRHRADSPAPVAMQQLIDISRLMCAVKCARSEMDNADGDIGAIVGRNGDRLRQGGKGALAQNLGPIGFCAHCLTAVLFRRRPKGETPSRGRDG